MMSIKSRLHKINAVAQASNTYLIPRHNERYIYHCTSVRTNKPYQVTLIPNNNNVWVTSLFTFDWKESDGIKRDKLAGNHPANFSKTVCYQGLGIAKKYAKGIGKILSICKSRESALRLLRLGGKLVKVVNLNGGVVWCTVR